jgi:pyruvate formate lyase activating enzyme
MVKGLVFNIQRFCLHDGPGIRTVVFLKGCPLRCAWCHNPESQLPHPELLFDESKCINCLRCVKACPQNAIRFNGKIFVDEIKCNLCGLCEHVCPTGALAICGKWMTVEGVIEEVIRDKVFYDKSGGGLTISGGEPTLQHEFTLELCKLAKSNNISVVLETNGFCDSTIFSRILNCVDLVLYDIKAVDEAKHRALTGASNKLILSNLRLAIAKHANIIVRIPVVPNVNVTKEEFDQFAELLAEIGVKRVDLLPYHKLGIAKYKLLRRPYKLTAEPPSDEFLNDFKNAFTKRGIFVTISGLSAFYNITNAGSSLSCNNYKEASIRRTVKFT